jgi:hypothetical protein
MQGRGFNPNPPLSRKRESGGIFLFDVVKVLLSVPESQTAASGLWKLSISLNPWEGGRLQSEREGKCRHKERIFINKHRRRGLCH